MAERFDIFTTKKWKMDSNDNLIVEATPTRSGIFKYHDGKGGIVRELRHPDDVFSQETLDSLNQVPYSVQKNHISLFTPKDTRGKAYGVTFGKATRTDNNETASKIKIWDDSEIKSVTKGNESLELSCGYKCNFYKNEDGSLLSGKFDGEDYDVRQKDIRYNHVCRVEKARGGESCRIRLDSADSAICGIEAERLDSGETQNHSPGDNMSEKTKVIHQRELPLRESGKFRLDAQEIKIDEDQKDIIDTIVARENKLFTALTTANTALVEQSVKMDSLTAENKTLVKNAENSIPAERMDQEIEKRTNLYKMAEESKIKDFKTMSIKDLSKKIVEQSKMFDDAKLDSDEYVNFALEYMQSDHAKKVLKSRANLENSPSIKFDEDADGESALEAA